MKQPKIDKTVLWVWIVLMILDLAAFGLICAVVWHFIQKFW